MAEPQRASSLTVGSSRSHRLPKLRPPRPAGYAAALQVPLDATQDLSPSARRTERAGPPASVGPAVLDPQAEVRSDARAQRPALPLRTPGEWTLIAVLLGGLALNAVALVTSGALSGSDRLLGSAVFLGGVALLVLIEICRRTDCGSR